jgi:hypothetical protein
MAAKSSIHSKSKKGKTSSLINSKENNPISKSVSLKFDISTKSEISTKLDIELVLPLSNSKLSELTPNSSITPPPLVNMKHSKLIIASPIPLKENENVTNDEMIEVEKNEEIGELDATIISYLFWPQLKDEKVHLPSSLSVALEVCVCVCCLFLWLILLFFV